METNKLIIGVMAAFIGIVMLAAVLMPVLNDATTTHETFTNDGYYRVSKITEDTDVTITWSYENPKVVTVGDKTADLSGIPNDLQVTILGTDECVTRYQSYASGTAQRIQSYSDSLSFNAAASTTTNNGITTVEIDGFDLTYYVNTTTGKSSTITSGYYIDPDGDYIMKRTADPAYMHKNDSIILLSGISNYYGLFAEGTINDGLNFTSVFESTNTITFGDVTFNYTDVSGYNSLVSLTSCEFEQYIDDGNSTTTNDLTYSYFVVPYQVTAERSVHLTDAMNGILNVIPVLIIVAVLLGVVAVFITRRE